MTKPIFAGISRQRSPVNLPLDAIHPEDQADHHWMPVQTGTPE